MNSTLFKRFTLPNLVLFFCVLLEISFVFSKFLLSISLISILILGFYYVKNEKIAFEKKQVFLFAIPFLLVLVSGLWSDNLKIWAQKTQLYLPFLAFPLAFSMLPAFSERKVKSLLSFFYYLILITTCYILFRFFQNYEQIVETLKKGQSVWMPTGHVYFSIMMVISVAIGEYLRRTKFYIKNNLEHKFYPFGIGFLILVLHIFSARLGLLCFYFTALMYIIIQIFQQKHHFKGWLALILLILLPFLGYYLIPSFQVKIDYIRWQMLMIQQGNLSDYSDIERWYSIFIGWNIAKQYPLLGVGYGDVLDEMKKAYAQIASWEKEPKLPHNQYVLVATATGFLGLFVFLLGQFLYLKKIILTKNNLFLLMLFLIFAIGNMVDCLFESTIGISLFSYFFTIHLKKA